MEKKPLFKVGSTISWRYYERIQSATVKRVEFNKNAKQFVYFVDWNNAQVLESQIVKKTTPSFCDAQICNELLQHCDSCRSNTELSAKINALRKQAGI